MTFMTSIQCIMLCIMYGVAYIEYSVQLMYLCLNKTVMQTHHVFLCCIPSEIIDSPLAVAVTGSSHNGPNSTFFSATTTLLPTHYEK